MDKMSSPGFKNSEAHSSLFYNMSPPLETDSLDGESNLNWDGGQESNFFMKLLLGAKLCARHCCALCITSLYLTAIVQGDVPGNYSDGLALHPGSIPY